MSLYTNTDAFPNNKPKMPALRQTREITTLTTNNYTYGSGNTVIGFVYNDGAYNNVAQTLGFSTNTYVYGANLSANGVANFFFSNNRISSISGNVITFTNATFGTLAPNTVIEFDKPIVYDAAHYENTYYRDVILVNATRANSPNAALGNVNHAGMGWTHIRKKTNSDGTIRFMSEILVSVANGQIANTPGGGNTSFGQVYTV